MFFKESLKDLYLSIRRIKNILPWNALKVFWLFLMHKLAPYVNILFILFCFCPQV